MRVLISGGCGFVGTNLALHFSMVVGAEVVCVDNLSRYGTEFNKRRMERHGIRVIDKSIQEVYRDNLLGAFKPTVVLNCAAQSSATKGIHDPSRDFYDNLETVLAALEICRDSPGCSFIQWSTNKVYSDTVVNSLSPAESVEISDSNETGPRSVYGATKIAAEHLIEEWSLLYDIPAIVNRFSCLAGPYQMGCADQGWVALWVIAHMFGIPLTYYGYEGHQVRDVLHAEDLCKLITLQAKQLEVYCGFCVYNVGGGPKNALSLLEATQHCQNITGRSVPTSRGPRRWADHRRYVSDITSVCVDFKWQPTERSTPLNVLQDIYEWAKSEESDLRQIYLGQ